MKRGVSSLFRLIFKRKKPDIKLLLRQADNLLSKEDYSGLNEIYKRIEKVYRKLNEKEKMEIEHKLIDLYYDILIARINNQYSTKE